MARAAAAAGQAQVGKTGAEEALKTVAATSIDGESIEEKGCGFDGLRGEPPKKA